MDTGPPSLAIAQHRANGSIRLTRATSGLRARYSVAVEPATGVSRPDLRRQTSRDKVGRDEVGRDEVERDEVGRDEVGRDEVDMAGSVRGGGRLS